jgi:hypothetical protein
MSHTARCIILVIRLTASLTLVIIWIICSPSQSIGRSLIFSSAPMLRGYACLPQASYPKWYHFFHAQPPRILRTVNRAFSQPNPTR